MQNQERDLLGVSSVAYHKNFVKLIEAFLLLKDKDVKLYIVGGFNTKIFGKDSLEILNIVKNNKNIVFLGRVSDDKLVELYSNAICFVYPSLYEGFGIPPLEAQSCGCPIVISDIPVFREIYCESDFFFYPYNTVYIAQKIINVINDSSLREILIKKGFENAKQYKWESSAKQFFKILDKV